MANTLPTTMEYFDTLLGEQLLGEEGGGGGGGSTYHAEVEWDYEAWTGRIISGSYESLMAVYNDYKNPIIHVTLTNYEGDTYTGEAVGVIVDGANIIGFSFPKNLSGFIWTPSNEFSCQD